MATVRQCKSALERLAATLDAVDPELRRRHVPNRTVLCRVKDLDVCFSARVDPDGVHDIALVKDPSADGAADVRLAVASDDLVALADGDDGFLDAWLKGRVQISASMRDMLRLRSLVGL